MTFYKFGDGESHSNWLIKTICFEDEFDALVESSKPSNVGAILVSMLFVLEHADERQSLARYVAFRSSCWMDEKWQLEGHFRGSRYNWLIDVPLRDESKQRVSRQLLAKFGLLFSTVVVVVGVFVVGVVDFGFVVVELVKLNELNVLVAVVLVSVVVVVIHHAHWSWNKAVVRSNFDWLKGSVSNFDSSWKKVFVIGNWCRRRVVQVILLKRVRVVASYGVHIVENTL